MKKLSVLFIMALVFCGTLLFAETLDEILAKNYETSGGLEKLKAVKTMKFTGKIVMAMQNMEMPATLWFKKPNKMRMETTIMDNKVTTAFDGEKAWMVVPMLGSEDPQEVPEEQAKMMAEQAETMNPLVDYKERGDKLELIGKEDMEGTEVYKLKMTKKSGRVIDYFLDVETGIELKTAAYVKMGETETLVETLMGDYKEVDGIMIPFAIESKAGGFSSKIVIESAAVNEEMPDSLFQMPPKKSKPQEEKK